jgi:3-hydroxybutyryl-CoA dehydrogenase
MKAKEFRMGPFELMDFIGNDVNYAVSVSVWEQLYYDPRYRPSVTQKRLCEAGRLGRKAGAGFYDYDNASPRPAAESGLSAEAIFLRILCMLINEAADAIYYGIAGKEDIETAMTRGVNYPKGLLHWCDELGAGAVYNELVRLRSEYSEDRYRPSVLLKKMAGEKGRFFS